MESDCFINKCENYAVAVPYVMNFKNKAGFFPTNVDNEAFADCLKTAWELTQVAKHQQNNNSSKESKRTPQKGSFTTIEEN